MKGTLLPIILLVALIPILHAQTPVSGYILSNTTWNTLSSPYIVTGNILVGAGVTLTIQPGVVVKFDTTKTLQIDGQLIAIGTAQNRITFTASDPTPVRGSWGRIQFSNTAVDAVFDTAGRYVSGSVLKYCDVRYGGGIAGDVTLYCDTAAPYFSNCRIAECLKHVIKFVNAVGRVDSSSIRNCGGTAIEYASSIPDALIVKNDTLENNDGGIGRNGNAGFSSITIQNCVFTNSGNALSSIRTHGNSIIENNSFISNIVVLTGHLGMNGTISNNTFIGNSKGVIGFSACYDNFDLAGDNVIVTDNLFENNKGVIVMRANYAVIQNNNFRNNQFFHGYCPSPFGGGGSYYADFINLKCGQGLIINNVIDSTTTGGYDPLINIKGPLEIANNLITNNFPGTIACNTPVNVCSNKFLNNSGTLIYSVNSSGTAYIHHNELKNNKGAGSITSFHNNSTLNNNEFTGNSCSGNNFILSISGSSPTITHNRFTNNSCTGSGSIISLSGSSPIISDNKFISNLVSSSSSIVSVSNGSSNFHNNDFLNNTGLSCLRISANPLQPVITQNNFNNPGILYEVENLIPFGPGSNFNVSNNYWGTINTAHIDSVIKDYFDDANLSVVLYLPVLTSPAFIDTTASCTSVVCSLGVNDTIVNPSCYGSIDGSINISTANGTAPYSYTWSNGGTTQNRNNLTSGTYTVTVVDSNFCSTTKSFTLTQPTSPVSIISGVVTDANCNIGGVINITAGGGTGPYTYNWGNSITTEDRSGLNTGNYTVTITDSKGCTASQSFVIGQVDGPTITGVTTNLSCHNTCDGSINLSVTGIMPFIYNWGSGFGASEDTTGLCAGSYSVTVADSNNCGIAATFTITSPAQLVASAGITGDVSCFGYGDGTASAVTTGGTTPYSFLWNNGQTSDTATALAAGTYIVTVTDSLGCTDSASVAIPDGFRVFAGAIIGLNSAVVNQHYAYSVNASPNYTYDWSVNGGIIFSGQGTNGIEVAWTSAGNGIIQLIAQEQGCADTVSKSITITDTTRNCSALFYLYPDTIPHSYFAINSASGIAQLSYSWSWGDNSPADTVPYPTHTYASPGFYTICLTITDSSGCSDTYCHPYFLLKNENELNEMIRVNVYPPSYTGINHDEMNNVMLYPNPTNSSFTISAPTSEQARLILFDAIGKQVSQQIVTQQQLSNGVTMDMHHLEEGVCKHP